MHVGEELKNARLARGLSLEQVSASTRVTYARLDAIERNSVLGMPLVYVRGYVREFAREVGLDPDDVTDRYIAQFETTTSEPAATVALDTDEVATDLLRDDDEWELRREVATAPEPWRPRRVHLLGLILAAIAATAVGFMIGWGASRVGRSPADRNPAAERSSAASADVERAGAGGGADADRANAEAPAIGGADPPPPTPAAREADDAARSSEAAPPETSPVGTADLDGAWTLSNEVQASSVAAYRGLRLEYRVQLQQNGARVTGQGEKISENGRPLRASTRTPISLSGTIEGDRVHLTFREQGRRRESAGTLQLQLTDDGSLRGTFESDAARSSGPSIARRAQ